MSREREARDELARLRPLLNDLSPTALAVDAGAPLAEIAASARRELEQFENPYRPAARHRWAYERVAHACGLARD